MKKRVVSWLLVVLMLTSMLPTGVWAEDVYRSSEDTGRYGVSTLASAADAELEGFFDEWEGIATVANAAKLGFVKDGDKLKSGNTARDDTYTRSTLTVTMLQAAELSFDYQLDGATQNGMEVKNGSKTLYTYSSYGAGGAEKVNGNMSSTATVQANAGDVITISYYRGYASSGSNCMWLSNFKASLPAQVIFHANDGTETTVQQGVFGSGTLQANTFKRDGYRFEGWATTPDGAVAYADKDSITITENTDLYAVWTRVYRVAFQLTPADAQFSLYGDEARTALIAADSGTAYTLAAGTYYYSVSAFGYAAVQGSVTVSGDAQEPVVLAEKPVVTVTFAYADGKTDVDGGKLTVRTGERDMAAEEGSDGMAFRLPAGYAYDWSFRSANYGKQSGTVDLTGVSESGTRSVTIPMTAKSAWEGAGDISEPAAVDGVYQITSGSELAWLAQQVNAGVSDGTSFSAVLCNDIDLGDEAWTPIGNGTGKAYKGTFDGQGYTIRNLYVTGSTPMDYGLFGTVYGGTVRNVTVEGRVEVTSNSSRYGIAAIVGQLYGTTGGVENCLNRASVKGGQYVGGIVGYVAGGSSSAEKFIKNCGNVGDVTSEGHRAAGIAANISGQVAVENCYSTGTITGGGWYSGGISAYVDSSYASVKNCYAAGSVTGSGAGAVFGKVSYSSTVVANCYYPDTLSVGDSKAVKVTEQQLKTLDSAAALGEAFMQDAKSINGGYPILTWQITTYEVTFTVTPEDAEVRIDGAKGKQNGNVWTFRLPEGTYSYTALAFGYADESGTIEVSGAARKDITLTPVEKRTVRFSVTPKDAGAAVTVQWNGKTVAAEQDGSYRLPDGTYTYTVRAKGYAKVSQPLEVSGDVTVPVVLEPSAAWDGQTVTAPEVGDGTEASPYEIENGEQLAWLARTVNAGNGGTRLYAVLTEDIDLGDGAWTPIGADSHEFTGRFDGQGHTVSRMKAEARYAGLFGVVKDAEIRGVVVQGIAAGTDSSSGDAAGLVARTKGSTVTITECGSEVAVSGGANGGGILGKNHSSSTVVTISACYNTGDISGKERAGGISGGNTGKVNISDCYNTGSINGGSYAGGGIRGYYGGFEGTVANCYNSGAVTGTNTGAIAPGANSRISNCFYLDSGTDGNSGAAAQTAQQMQELAISDAFEHVAGRNGGMPVLKWQKLAPVVNADGMVVYTDAEQITERVSFAEASADDCVFHVKDNGSTVRSITMGSRALVRDTEYRIGASANGQLAITLTNSFLTALTAGSYTLTVSYDPLGETYVSGGGNQAPASTTVVLTVGRSTVDADIASMDKIYDSEPVTPSANTESDGVMTWEFKPDGADPGAYTTAAPEDAGTYNVRLTVAETEHYDRIEKTATFTISPKEIQLHTPALEDKTYDGSTAIVCRYYYPERAMVGKISGDDLSVVMGQANADSPDVGRRTVTFTGFGLTGSDAANYRLTAQPISGSAAITARPLSIGSLTVRDKLYDGLNTAAIEGTPTLVNLADGETLMLRCGTPTFDTVAAGDNIPVSFTEFTIADSANGKAGNYSLTQPAGITASIKAYTATGAEYTASTGQWTNQDFMVTAADGWQVSGTNTANGDWRGSLTRSDETGTGSLTFYVKNTADGYISESVTLTYKIDKTNPTGEIRIDQRNAWQSFWNTISFDLFYKSRQTVTMTAADEASGVTAIEYLLSEEDYTAAQLDGMTLQPYTAPVAITPDDRLIAYARITDAAGNVTYLRSDGVVLDAAAPVIAGVDDGAVYCGSVTFTVTDAYLDTVTVDGTAAVSAPGRAAGSTYIIEADSQLHTIVATDRAGNSTQVQITVNNGHTVGTPASCKAPAVCRYCGESFGDPAPGNHGGLLRRVEKVNATSTADGNIEYWYCSGCGKYYLDAAAGREITRGDTILPAIGLRIVSDVRVWRPGDKTLGVTFRQEYGGFTVQIDGVTVDPANYEVTADPDGGRLIVTFRAQFLRTLAFGERTITIVSDDGSASVSFRRDSARAVTPGGKDGGKTGVTSAATGDGFPMGGMAAALLVSGSALVMLTTRARRKEEE